MNTTTPKINTAIFDIVDAISTSMAGSNAATKHERIRSAPLDVIGKHLGNLDKDGYVQFVADWKFLVRQLEAAVRGEPGERWMMVRGQHRDAYGLHWNYAAALYELRRATKRWSSSQYQARREAMRAEVAVVG